MSGRRDALWSAGEGTEMAVGSLTEFPMQTEQEIDLWV
jgi:hypothetical protein